MITSAIIILFFGFAYALKGGSGANIFPWWGRLRESNVILERLLDGKVISTLGVFLFSLFILTPVMVTISSGEFGVPEYDLDFMASLLIAAAWLLSVAPSMGEEHGAIGDHKEAWGQYVTNEDFGRLYGVKKGIQRGVWMGAFMALATGYLPFVCFSLLFVPCVCVGQILNRIILKQRGWTLAEPIIGAVVFGAPTALWFAA